jgi:paraquat-inducible protein B
MSKGASKTMIGGFVVGALALLIGAVVIFGSGAFFSKKIKLVLFFQESVSGLNIGAPVVIRGVTVGSVVDVQMWTYPKELKVLVPVYIELDPSLYKEKGDGHLDAKENLKRQIEKGLRAQLRVQSMVTGQLMIYGDYFPNKPARLVGAESRYPEVPTILSGIEEIKASLEKIPIQEVLQNLTKAIAGLENLINSPATKKITSNLNTTLEKSGLFLEDLQKLVQVVDTRINALSAEVQGALTETRQLIRNTDGQIAPLAAGLKTTLEEASKVLSEARQTLKKASETISEDSLLTAEIINSLDELNRTIRSINGLAEYLKQHPEALLWGKKPDGGK